MVYIGINQYRLGSMLMSHMVADSLLELHSMAARLHISKIYFQNIKNKQHYDVCKTKKLQALKYGALLVNDRIIVQICKASV